MNDLCGDGMAHVVTTRTGAKYEQGRALGLDIDTAWSRATAPDLDAWALASARRADAMAAEVEAHLAGDHAVVALAALRALLAELGVPVRLNEYTGDDWTCDYTITDATDETVLAGPSVRFGDPKHGGRIVSIVNAVPSILDRLDEAERLLEQALEWIPCDVCGDGACERHTSEMSDRIVAFLKKSGRGTCAVCGHPQDAHPYRHPFKEEDK